MKVNVGCNALTMYELAGICGGMLCFAGGETNRNVPFRSVCTDSRETEKDSLFVALGGARVDGHDYIGAALSLGSECVLCERIPDTLNSSERKYVALVVQDTLRAVGELAKAYDRRINNRKVAITGSVGKTTTKEFVAAVLSENLRLHKTEGNYNSNIGMPLSMLTMRNDTEVSVLEMGMSNAGEIEYLSRIAEPDIAIITNIGSSHMEYLGSREGICKAKLEIVKGLKKDGILLLNGDEPLLRNREEIGDNAYYVGFAPDCHFRAQNMRFVLGNTMFDISIGGRIVENVSIPTIGKHNVYAACFAYAVGVNMGLSDEIIKRGLRNFKPIGMRQNIYDIGDITIIEDCYNASPESMKAAIAVLRQVSEQKARGRMTALLGDMYELGIGTDRFHEEVGLEFARQGGSALFTFGELADMIAGGAMLGGVPCENIYRNTDVRHPEISGEMLLASLAAGDTLLVKASRGAAAERVIRYLEENKDRLPRLREIQ
ncbi:MAG: UDP-N-acetylmuramoyl-tripeptide--D-alanyl-D-alanine ligase [Clostridia bacterium]|nr:UDP-N-acetylmuramoyl-tripeptide--D-alanyl-D-alanine ligase [Clostridia bacterium]